MSNNPDRKRLRISKLDAARRQLETAIRLYFNNGDVVSVHTLTAAAFNITRNISDSSESLPDSVAKRLEGYVKPEYKKTFWKKIHETANFLKHANHDPNGVHEFYPEETEHLLFMAVYQYQALTADTSSHLRLFITWYMIKHPKIFNAPPEVGRLGKKPYGYTHDEFYRELLPLIEALPP